MIRLSQLRVRGDATAYAEVRDARLLDCRHCLGHLHVNDGRLKGRRKVGQVDGTAGAILALDVGDDGRLEAREREPVVATVHHGAREVDGARVALGGKPADHRTSGIAQPQRLGHLVKGLAHGVVDGGAQDLVVAPAAHVGEQGVAAGDQACHEGGLEVRRLEEVGEKVPLEVMHRDERHARCGAEPLCKRDTHNERTNKAGACGDAHGREVGRGQRVAAEVRAGLCHGLLVDAHDRLDMLAAGNLGHHTAKARVEVDGGGDHARAHGAVRVHHGHGRLVAGGLDREDQVAGGGKRLPARGVARTREDGPRANGGVRLGTHAQRLDVSRQREPCAQDEGVVTGGVVARTPTHLDKAQVGIGGPRGLVPLVHLQRGGLCVEDVRVIAQARRQTGGHPLPAMPLLHGHIAYLEVIVRHHAAGKADDAAKVVRHPPAAARLKELLVEEPFGPGGVGGAREGRGLQRGDGGQVVHRHGAQLQVPVGQRVVHTRDLDARGRLEAQALALVLLGVREARVDGKHQRRIARVQGGRGCGERQPLARGVPQPLVQDALEAGRLKARAVLLEPVARKDEPGGVLACRPCRHALVGFAHGLGGEGAVRSGVIQLVDARVDLAAHGVVGHAEKPAHARLPDSPCRGIQDRDAMERP